MKRTTAFIGMLLMIALVAFTAIASGQTTQDTTLTIKIKIKCGNDNVSIFSSQQSLSIPINVACPPVEHRVLYIDAFDQILGTTEEQKLKWYLKDYEFDGMALYKLQNILGNSTKETQLKVFIADCRRNYGIVIAEAVRGDLPGVTGKLKAYQLSCTDTMSRFTSMNLEYEFWNFTDKLSAFLTDSTYMAGMSSTAKELTMDNCQYIGWFKSPVESRAPRMLQKYSQHDLVHYYRTFPDSSYGSSRVDSLNAAALVVIPFYGIFSTEVDFMRDWCIAHPGVTGMKQAEGVLKPFINRHSKVKWTGSYWFCYSTQKICNPPKVHAAPSAKMISEKAFSYKFIDKTLSSHKRMAQQQ